MATTMTAGLFPTGYDFGAEGVSAPAPAPAAARVEKDSDFPPPARVPWCSRSLNMSNIDDEF